MALTPHGEAYAVPYGNQRFFTWTLQIELSGAVKGKAVWPSHLKPVAWHRDAKMVRWKLGVYHATHKVAEGDVQYKNISIEGPNGIIRSSPASDDDDDDDDDEQTCSADGGGVRNNWVHTCTSVFVPD